MKTRLVDVIQLWDVKHCGKSILIERPRSAMSTWAHCQECNMFVDPNALYSDSAWYDKDHLPFCSLPVK